MQSAKSAGGKALCKREHHAHVSAPLRRILHGGAKRHEVELIIDKHQKLVDRHFGSARAQFIERLQKICAFFVILRGCFERRVKIRISVGKAYLRQLIGGKAECAGAQHRDERHVLMGIVDHAEQREERGDLRGAEKSAALLLPRAPAAGKRILLEYLTPLWKRMSFSQKTTARNLFRYKKRFFMTVLGVAGCTALLLIGFGIQDSLLPMLTKQTTELTHADLTISLSDEKALTMENGLADLLDSSSGITSWGRYYTKSVTLYNAAGEKETVSLVAAADESQMTEYFTFRTRQGHKAIAFDDSSVILTEKTAEKLGLSVGDSFEVETTDGGRRSLTLTGITENYVFTRLYLSQAQLKTLNGGALPTWNAVYGQTDCPTDAARASLSSSILACNYVSSVSFIEDTTQMFDGLIGCLNYVVMLVIVCAAALAAVVLYNLISVNLGERKKELATIKVLGFYDKEVYRYIFREIDLLSLIGSLVGLMVGIPLHQFIIRTVEMDQMMFIRSIAPRSFVFSVALTMLFNFAVCLLMRRHVRQISMVESMKAPE